MEYNVYDFDGTIYNGDSGVDFVKFAIRKKPKVLLYLIGSLGTVILYLFGARTKEELKNKIFRFIPEIDNMATFVKEFWEKHEKKIKPFWKEQKDHKNDIISSASCRFWLEPIAKKYKVAHLFATDVDLTTGEIIGSNCHGEEKVRLFYIEYPKGVVNEMYTDSLNDLPMIKEAKQGYMVKKNKIMKFEDYKPGLFKRFWNWGWGIYHKNEEIWNYIIVGGFTTLISIGIKWGLYFTILDVSNKKEAQIGVIVSWIFSVLFAYVADRIIVFKSKNKKVFKELFSFYGARVATLLMESALTYLFFNVIGLTTKIWIIIVTFIIQVLIMTGNYLISKLFVFRKK